uniref:Uncharacterized protein n=1 Tax=Arundo donax TaxID=35708 RepID=A0A0A9GR32_ARUDO
MHKLGSPFLNIAEQWQTELCAGDISKWPLKLDHPIGGPCLDHHVAKTRCRDIENHSGHIWHNSQFQFHKRRAAGN